MYFLYLVFFNINSRSLDKHRGYAFVEFDLEEDAQQAIDNMDGAELLGKVIRCNLAKAMPKLESGQAVWNSEEWIKQKMATDLGEDAMQIDKVADLTLVPTRHDDDEEDDDIQ